MMLTASNAFAAKDTDRHIKAVLAGEGFKDLGDGKTHAQQLYLKGHWRGTDKSPMAEEIIESSKTFFGSREGLEKRVGEDIDKRLLKGTKGLYADGFGS